MLISGQFVSSIPAQCANPLFLSGYLLLGPLIANGAVRVISDDNSQ